MKKTVKDMVDKAEGEIKTITLEEALEHHGDENYVFVDIRDVRELDRDGMIPDAFHAPRGMLEFWIDPESPYHKDIFASGKTFVFYCRSSWRSALATQTAQNMGLEPVCHFEGGFGAWMEAGAPVAERPRKTNKKSENKKEG